MKNILDRLLELKGTQNTAAFGRSVGLNQQTMDRYLKGREPPIGVIRQLCMVYGVSADWLLGLPERDGTSTAIANGGVAITGSGNKIRGTIVASGDHGHDKCSECKFKKFAEAFKAIQTPA